MDSWKGRGNQYIQYIRVLYCKLPTNGKQLPAFPLEAVPGSESRPQRWEARMLPLCHRGPLSDRTISYQCDEPYVLVTRFYAGLMSCKRLVLGVFGSKCFNFIAVSIRFHKCTKARICIKVRHM